jgi:hypothetical protein
MWKAYFQFEGGSVKKDQGQYKFHCFVVNSDKQEYFLHSAVNKGIVSSASFHMMDSDGPIGGSVLFDPNKKVYRSIVPIIKLFTATSGFGIAKEYFSYFIALEPNSSKFISIKPLGHDVLNTGGYREWGFGAPGRFMRHNEIRAYFGADSQTYKFYSKQSFISKSRLLKMVEVKDHDCIEDPVEEEETRCIRFE